MSDPVPSAWVEAVAQAMVAAGMNYGTPIDDHLAAVAIAAVGPFIRADERERIAQAIEERLKEMHSDLSNPRYEEAVRIARNGGSE